MKMMNEDLLSLLADAFGAGQRHGYSDVSNTYYRLTWSEAFQDFLEDNTAQIAKWNING